MNNKLSGEKEERSFPIVLPRIEIDGKTYFIDKRLMELRNVKNPSDSIHLHEIEMWLLLEHLGLY